MRSSFTARTDPVTFEVIRHRLWQINDEQGKTIINVSGSPVASEGNDLNVALTDSDGNIVSIGPYILLHVSAITLVIKSAMALFREQQIKEGDMYLSNDPWMGAGHQNDVCVIQPVFYEGRRVAWTASVIHQVDVGGPYPGSWNPFADNVFDEAPRYRFLRLVRDYEVQPEVLDTYLTNSRTPELLELDARAQIAAANVARTRLHELMRRYGVKTVTDAMADSLDHAEWLFSQKLKALPDGEWYAEDYLDHDGHAERVYTVRCRLQKRDDRLLFDFRGTSPQAAGFINCTHAGAVAGVFGAVFPYLCADIPWNAGVLRNIDIRLDEHTVHNATLPAPVGFGVVHACSTTTNAAASVLGKLLSCSASHWSEAMAGWQGASLVYNLFGETAAGKRFATMLLSSDMQGCGARAFGDGFDVGGKLSAPRSKVANIEAIEGRYPVLYLYRRRTCDSGGAGRWRGGVSAEVAFAPHGAGKIEMTINTLGVAHSCAPGLCGGYPGGSSFVLLKQHTDIERCWASGVLPVSLDQLEGKDVPLPAKSRCELLSGDVFIAIPHGGGGFGDPIEREPDLVANDVKEFLVSPAAAKSLYGVVLTSHGDADEAASRDLRRRMRLARLDSGTGMATMANDPGPVSREAGSAGQPYGAMVLRDGIVCCGCCGAHVADIPSGKFAALVSRQLPLGAVGRLVARYWNGDSPYFEVLQQICPKCGAVISTEQCIKGESAQHSDFVLTQAD